MAGYRVSATYILELWFNRAAIQLVDDCGLHSYTDPKWYGDTPGKQSLVARLHLLEKNIEFS